MHSISNAFFQQAEVVQRDRWDHGPLELIFLPGWHPGNRRLHVDRPRELAIYEWNRSASGGFVRSGKLFDLLKDDFPFVQQHPNPNLIFVPHRGDGYTELHGMLASVLPGDLLTRFGLTKQKTNLGLGLAFWNDVPRGYAQAAAQAFETFIWTKLAPRAKLRPDAFSPNSPLRLLAGDTRLWMHRLYRIAVDRHESFEEAEDTDENWEPLDILREKLMGNIPEADRDKFDLRRPLRGGWLWDINDAEDCNAVVEEMLDGCGVMESLYPVIEAIRRRPTHEDFSERYSWIKEDFERSFYSKRSKLKVSLVETVDDFPAWDPYEFDGYQRTLLRDILAVLDARERHLLIAIREGRTISDIAQHLGHSGHAAVSRRLKRLKQKVRALLQ